MDDLGVEVILAQLRRNRQDLEDSVKQYDSATTTDLLEKLTNLSALRNFFANDRVATVRHWLSAEPPT